MQEWAVVLGQLSGDDVKRGMDAWGGQYPPNVFQFRDACSLPAVVPAHKRFQRGPHLRKAGIDVARGQIEAMKRKINLHYL